MFALRLLARLMLWMSLVLALGVAFAWTWDHADRGDAAASPPAPSDHGR